MLSESYMIHNIKGVLWCVIVTGIPRQRGFLAVGAAVEVGLQFGADKYIEIGTTKGGTIWGHVAVISSMFYKFEQS